MNHPTNQANTAITQQTDSQDKTDIAGGFMGPLAVLTAIILGSSLAIEFGLSGVLVIFWVLRSESAQIESEITRLPIYCLVFLLLAGAAGSAMYSLMKGLSWRWRAQAGMWGLVGAIALWFGSSR